MSSKYTKSIRGKLFKYFKQRLNIKPSTKGWYRSDCPICAGNYCFGVNMLKNRGKCFKCLADNNLVGILMYMENLQTLNDAKNFLNIQKEYDGYEDAVVQPKYEKKKVVLPESFRLINRGYGILGKSAGSYMKGRGYDLLDLTERGVGYCLEGEYAGYIIFPFYRKGELIFFQGRKFMGGGPKMQNPKNEDFGIGKTELIYNQDALFIYNRINVVESITNALTLGDNTIAILGKKISAYQFGLLMKSPCTHITLILDDDALEDAIELALRLVHYKNIRIVIMPKGEDVNNLGRAKTKELIRKAEYKTYNQLFKMRLNVKEITYESVKALPKVPRR